MKFKNPLFLQIGPLINGLYRIVLSIDAEISLTINVPFINNVSIKCNPLLFIFSGH